MKRTILAALALATPLAAAPTAGAVDLYAKDAKNLYRVDTISGAITLVGPTPVVANELSLQFGDRGIDGWIHAISYGFLSPRNLYRIDEQNGATTVLHPLGIGTFAPTGAAIDPTDGSFYVVTGGAPELRRIDLVTGAEITLGTISAGAANGAFIGLVSDAAGNLYTMERNSATLWSVNKANPGASSPVGTGLGGGLNFLFGGSLTRDISSNVVWGLEAVGQRLFRVDLATGVATLHGVPIGGAGAQLIALIGGNPCIEATATYGAGCAGQSDIVPTLAASSSEPCPQVGASVGVTIGNALGGATALLVFGLNRTSVPLGGGCALLVAPLVGPTLVLPLGGAGPGNGTLTLNGVVPPAAAGVGVSMQAFVLDAWSPIGAAATNGLELTFL